MTQAPPPDRALRGLLVDYGGVLTTSVLDAFQEFERLEGLEPAALARLLRKDPRARELLAGLEVGSATEAQFESGLGGLLGVPADGLISRLLRVRPEQAMIEAVRAVHESGVRTALVSNSWGSTGYPRELLHELFDVVLVSGEVGLRKPDPAIYLRAAGGLGVEPAECVFVDDLTVNLEPAARLGMTALHHTDPALTISALSRLFRVSIAAPVPEGAQPGSAQPR
jgi:epoxide hydrolase-like predicted phosphatase